MCCVERQAIRNTRREKELADASGWFADSASRPAHREARTSEIFKEATRIETRLGKWAGGKGRRLEIRARAKAKTAIQQGQRALSMGLTAEYSRDLGAEEG